MDEKWQIEPDFTASPSFHQRVHFRQDVETLTHPDESFVSRACLQKVLGIY